MLRSNKLEFFCTQNITDQRLLAEIVKFNISYCRSKQKDITFFRTPRHKVLRYHLSEVCCDIKRFLSFVVRAYCILYNRYIKQKQSSPKRFVIGSRSFCVKRHDYNLGTLKATLYTQNIIISQYDRPFIGPVQCSFRLCSRTHIYII